MDGHIGTIATINEQYTVRQEFTGTKEEIAQDVRNVEFRHTGIFLATLKVMQERGWAPLTDEKSVLSLDAVEALAMARIIRANTYRPNFIVDVCNQLRRQCLPW